MGDQIVYPCELADLYASDMQTVPSLFRFDYMIKSRTLDLIVPCGNVVPKPADLVASIQQVWYLKNVASVNLTQIDVKLGESYFFTSIFNEYMMKKPHEFF